MSDMPKRPRAHVLEAEARVAFKSLLLPRGWVIRDHDNPDYGVDDHVEVFTEDGDATGLEFYVQSRGTDKPLESALSTKLTTSQQNYFASLGLPVLIARYHSPSQRTFGKWFHRFDPYPLKTSQVVHFTENNEITKDNAGRLEDEVRSYRHWHSPYLNWPIETDIVSEEKASARDIRLSCYSLIEGDALVKFRSSDSVEQATPETTDSRLLVTIAPQAIRVEASHASHTIHTSTAELLIPDAAALVVYGVSSVLHRLGHPHQAGQLLAFVLKSLPLTTESTEHAGQILAAGSAVDPISGIVEHRLANANGSSSLESAIFLLTVFAESALLPKYDDRRTIAVLFERLAQAVRDSGGDVPLAFAAMLASARLRFSVGDWQKANDLFDTAVTDGQSPVSRVDVITEVAGAAHESGDYARAVALYTETIELLPERTRLRLRLADSLMYAGRYRRARREFEAYFSDESVSTYEPLWHLKYALLLNMTDGGIPDRDRRTAAAISELTDRKPHESRKEADGRFRRAAMLDPMSAEVWADIGQFEIDRGDRHRAAGPLTNAALLRRTPRSWAIAIDNAVRQGLTELAEHAAAVALYDHGDEFHIALRAEVGSDEEGNSTVEWVESRDAEWGRRRRGKHT